MGNSRETASLLFGIESTGIQQYEEGKNGGQGSEARIRGQEEREERNNKVEKERASCTFFLSSSSPFELEPADVRSLLEAPEPSIEKCTSEMKQ